MDLDGYRHRSTITIDSPPEAVYDTEVTQTWEVLPAYADGFATEENPGMTLEQRLDLMKVLAERGMPETLANLKRDAESSPTAGG